MLLASPCPPFIRLRLPPWPPHPPLSLFFIQARRPAHVAAARLSRPAPHLPAHPVRSPGRLG
eukprot:2934268-Prymnesium_polylepis.3